MSAENDINPQNAGAGRTPPNGDRDVYCLAIAREAAAVTMRRTSVFGFEVGDLANRITDVIRRPEYGSYSDRALRALAGCVGRRLLISAWRATRAREKSELTAGTARAAEKSLAQLEQLSAPEYAELVELFRRALAQVGGLERDALRLHYVENRSWKDISRDLDVPRTSLNRRVQVALDEMRQFLLKEASNNSLAHALLTRAGVSETDG